DIVDGSDPVAFSENGVTVVSGDTFGLGTHTIVETATDSAGNASTASFTIKVQDTTAPVISGQANETVEATGPAGAAVAFTATAADAVDVTDNVAFTENGVTAHSGDAFGLGTHTIVETATDSAGNSSAASFTIKVQD